MARNIMSNGEPLVLKDLNVWYTKGKPVLEMYKNLSAIEEKIKN